MKKETDSMNSGNNTTIDKEIRAAEIKLDGMRRVFDQFKVATKRAALINHNTEMLAIRFFFVMNGSGILGLLTLLGAYHERMGPAVIIWILISLFLLVCGVLFTIFHTLSVMEYAGEVYLVSLKRDQALELKLSGWSDRSVKEIFTPTDNLEKKYPDMKKKECRRLSKIFMLFCFSIGCVTNALLLLNPTTAFCWSWLIGIIGGSALSALMYYCVTRLFDKKGTNKGEKTDVN